MEKNDTWVFSSSISVDLIINIFMTTKIYELNILIIKVDLFVKLTKIITRTVEIVPFASYLVLRGYSIFSAMVRNIIKNKQILI